MRFLFIALLLVSLPGHAQDKSFKDVSKLITTVQPDSIRAHIQYLADDRLKGRLPGTPEYKIAMQYVISHFKQMGIEPAGEDNSYFQKVPLRRAKLDPENVQMVFNPGADKKELEFGKDYVLMPHFEDASVMVEAPLVFVGYGISAPEFGYDDYAGVDVKGKIVVMVNGNPDKFSSTVKAHTTNRGTKLQTAIEKGAVGVIIREVSDRAIAGSKAVAITSGIVNVLNQEGNIFSPSSRGGGGMGLNLYAVISSSFFNQMINLSEEEMAKRLKLLTQGIPTSFELKSSIKATYQSRYTDIEGYNVVGIIKGSDPALRNEYIVHSSHLDHMGIGRAVKGDSIYNGAHDNASGVSCTLEVARLYAAMKKKPKRSIVFVMLTSEEMGLLGSTYFAKYPTVPKNSIVANINMDMPTIIAPLLSIVPLGAQHSSLMNQVKAAAAYLALEVEDDPEPDQNRFTRSDQYSFVEQGIPALHIKYGDKMIEPGKKLTEQVKIWRENIYHKPQDEITGTFDFEAGKKYVQLCFLISYQIGQEATRPVWNKGDFFGDKFGTP
jgi:Zn-dependent M28 family amino/carboxypeptidase